MVAAWSSPPPMGIWLCCHPMPVLWLTKVLCRKGFVAPVACGAREPGVPVPAGLTCGGGDVFAKGLVPVGVGCRGAGCCCCCCCWGNALPVGCCATCCCAKGFVDNLLGFEPAGAERVEGWPVGCWPSIMDARKGLVVWGAPRDWPVAPVG